MFVSIEGADGVGKTTQAKLLMHKLDFIVDSAVALVKEPGGTPFGAVMRDLVFGEEFADTLDITKAVLMLADHIEMQKETVEHLRNGNVVVADRSIDSALVYQGLYHNNYHNLRNLYNSAGVAASPHVVLLLDLDPVIAMKRMLKRKSNDSNDLRPIEFHTRIRKCFHALMTMSVANGNTWVMVDGNGTVDEVHNRVMDAINEVADFKIESIGGCDIH